MKVRIISIADGSIMATIMMAHIMNTASTLLMDQLAFIGIINLASGWDMSDTAQARKTHPSRMTNSNRLAARGSHSLIPLWLLKNRYLSCQYCSIRVRLLSDHNSLMV